MSKEKARLSLCASVEHFGDVFYARHEPTGRRQQVQQVQMFFTYQCETTISSDDSKKLLSQGAQLHERVAKKTISFGKTDEGTPQMTLIVTMTRAELASKPFVDKLVDTLLRRIAAHIAVQLELRERNSGSSKDPHFTGQRGPVGLTRPTFISVK